MRKPAFCICENKDADQLRGNREADQRLCFAIRTIQFLYYLNPKFQASSHLLWLYSPVCVRPGRKPRRPVFSERGSYVAGLCSLYHDNRPLFQFVTICTCIMFRLRGPMFKFCNSVPGYCFKFVSKCYGLLFQLCHVI